MNTLNLKPLTLGKSLKRAKLLFVALIATSIAISGLTPAVAASPPPLVSISTDLLGESIILTYERELTGTPATSDFTIGYNGGNIPGSDVTSVTVSGFEVVIHYAFHFTSVDVLEISYSGTALEDNSGNVAAAFGPESVTNIVPAPTYDITYVTGQGSGTPPTALALEEGETFTIAANTFERPGYNFNQWGSSVGYFSPGDTFTVATSDITLFAEWLLDLSTYDAAISSVNENNYTAESWTNYQNVISMIFLSPMISSPAEVEAAVSTVTLAQADLVPLAPVTYNITYLAGDGTGTAPTPLVLTAGETFTLANNTFTNPGYNFKWWAGSNSSGFYLESIDFQTGVSSDITWTAIWELDLSAVSALINGVVEADYTSESWATYQAFLASYAFPTTPAEVLAVVDALTTAQGALVPAVVPGDLTAYNAVLARVTEADYTPISWFVYQSIVAANIVTTADAQAAITVATANIMTAQSDLLLVTPSSPIVPNVVGLTETAAGDALVADGFIKGAVTSTAVGATSGNNGQVKTQTPAAGSTLAQGESVALVLFAYTAPVETPVVSTPAPFIDYQALLAAKIAADAKAIVDAKAAADAKVAAEVKEIADAKAAAEKAAAAIAAAAAAAAESDAKYAAALKASQEEAAKIEAAVKKAAENTITISNSGKSRSKISMDLADKYFGLIAFVEVGTSIKGVMKYSVVDYLAIANDDGTASVLTKKLIKGQVVRVRLGKSVIVSKKIA